MSAPPSREIIFTGISVVETTPAGGCAGGANISPQDGAVPPPQQLQQQQRQQEEVEQGTQTERRGSRPRSGSTAVDLDDFIKQKLANMPQTEFVIKVEAAHDRSNTCVGFLRRVFVILLQSLIFIIINVILMAIPISKVIVGGLYFHDCPAEPLIAIFLIVDGGVTCVRDIWTIILRLYMTEEQYEKYEENVSAVAFVILLLQITWFIGGSVIVYKTLGSFQIRYRTQPDYCEEIFYWFAFWIVTANYIASTAVALVILMFLIILCCSAEPSPAVVTYTTTTSPQGGAAGPGGTTALLSGHGAPPLESGKPGAEAAVLTV